MKLKTLKDLHGLVKLNPKLSKSDWISKQELKAEAIKWVKQKRKIKPFFRATDGEDFMEFHNITEEDLE